MHYCHLLYGNKLAYLHHTVLLRIVNCSAGLNHYLDLNLAYICVSGIDNLNIIPARYKRNANRVKQAFPVKVR